MRVASLLALCVLAFAAPVRAADTPAAVASPLLTRPLPEFPGKETTLLTVELPPGAKSPVHRHDAHVFVYVLEGAVIMQVEGGVATTVKAGETFYENPNDIHVVSENASQIQKAKFLVFMIKDAGKRSGLRPPARRGTWNVEDCDAVTRNRGVAPLSGVAYWRYQGPGMTWDEE